MKRKVWLVIGAVFLQACSAVSIVSQVMDAQSAQAQVEQPLFRVECAVIASIDGKFDQLDSGDMRAFQTSYGQEADAGESLAADLNGDHRVDTADLKILGSVYPGCLKNPY
jgi:hypothetical protein